MTHRCGWRRFGGSSFGSRGPRAPWRHRGVAIRPHRGVFLRGSHITRRTRRRTRNHRVHFVVITHRWYRDSCGGWLITTWCRHRNRRQYRARRRCGNPTGADQTPEPFIVKLATFGQQWICLQCLGNRHRRHQHFFNMRKHPFRSPIAPWLGINDIQPAKGRIATRHHCRCF